MRKIRYNLSFGFTMAEAILVMAILGVIAAVMIATIRPAEYKEKGLLLKANKVLSEIDNATLQILTNDSGLGDMKTLFDENGQFEFKDDSDRVLKLYKKYLATNNKVVDSGSFCTTEGRTGTYLKDGSCIGIKAGEGTENTIFPEEDAIKSTTATQGFVYFDVNDKEEPNIIGKDQFIIPIVNSGIGDDSIKEEEKGCTRIYTGGTPEFETYCGEDLAGGMTCTKWGMASTSSTVHGERDTAAVCGTEEDCQICVEYEGDNGCKTDTYIANTCAKCNTDGTKCIKCKDGRILDTDGTCPTPSSWI